MNTIPLRELSIEDFRVATEPCAEAFQNPRVSVGMDLCPEIVDFEPKINAAVYDTMLGAVLIRLPNRDVPEEQAYVRSEVQRVLSGYFAGRRLYLEKRPRAISDTDYSTISTAGHQFKGYGAPHGPEELFESRRDQTCCQEPRSGGRAWTSRVTHGCRISSKACNFTYSITLAIAER
jgi:hypothetical protein